MNKGDRVKIYYDPLTESELEGEAILVRLVAGEAGYYNGRTINWWQVKFADGARPVRKILVPAP